MILGQIGEGQAKCRALYVTTITLHIEQGQALHKVVVVILLRATKQCTHFVFLIMREIMITGILTMNSRN